MKSIKWVIVGILFSCAVHAQSKDSLHIGKISGIAFDSSHNYVLKNASIAVYNSNKELITFTMSNNLGEFVLQQLPVNQNIRLVISYVGYQPFIKEMFLNRKNDTIDLHYLNVIPGDNNLHEIVIAGIPPVRMNGDTLEFSADAFHLDKNAVAEDLLTRLPGVTLWGDGTITVNGKTVSHVLVEGKPFFGGSTVVATQNIPKDAIDKIQVYQKNKREDNPNPFDSVTEMNIQLKADKKAGRFGKVSAGYGTRDTYEGDLSMNFFSPATQFGIIGAANNTNKTAGSVGQLMENSTFKGRQANIDYQPDFSRSGVNKAIASGLTYNHNFTHILTDKPHILMDNIGGDYSFRDNRTNNRSASTTLMTFGADSTLTQKSNGTNESLQITHDLSLHKLKIHKGNKIGLEFTPSASITQNDNTYNTSASSTSNKNDLLSISNTTSNTHTGSGRYTANTQFNDKLKNGSELLVYHSVNYQHSDNTLSSLSSFKSYTNQSANQQIDRSAKYITSNLQQQLNVTWQNISPLIFGYGHFMSTVNIDLYNELYQTTESNDNHVNDKDTLTKNFLANTYLTYNNRLNVINENPNIRIAKTFSRILADRYSKSLEVVLIATVQFYIQQNHSSHSFQEYKRDYNAFVPYLGFRYENDQFGRHRNSINMDIKRSYQYATTDMLYPIVDSTNFYYRTEGNPSLKPADNNVLSLKYDHTSKKIDYTFNVTETVTGNYLGSSSYVNESGMTVNKTVNLNGRRRLEVNGVAKKNFKLSKLNQLQVSDEAVYSNDRIPNYLNNVLNTSITDMLSNKVTLYFSHLDKLALNLSQNVSHYTSVQQGLDNARIKNLSLNTVLSASYNLTKKWYIGSNLTSNRFSSSAAAPVNFNIWNASTSYRLLKGSNLELKLAALDILGQNKNVANYGNSYTVTQTVNNVLQQYFMLTVSYFPRKFGK
ncbi:hypothetical protein GO495_02950 [Chitinophaga oryziterrae]|uniref:Outer membrane beta-barrel protein n=1 Tax=Chitinophaga oryziterrae TaxID=1031224 RepID=A0A6N8J3D2_9BACT|nr:TonB-dependent receptor [Chitinophaga oryziterrae]MVT39533.1 hypothetical protein [Chitinophaga oryziterrae]